MCFFDFGIGFCENIFMSIIIFPLVFTTLTSFSFQKITSLHSVKITYLYPDIFTYYHQWN